MSAATFTPQNDTIGDITTYAVQDEDNLYALARRFDVGIVEVLAANPGVDPWQPEKGTELTLPTMHVLPAVERKGLVLNLSELRLFYFPDPTTVISFPIGIGREGWQTPLGTTKIVAKRANPSWIPPASIRAENPELPEIIPPGPDNPMGAYALNLGWERYAIHGTNRPAGVGTRTSHGCIRLYPEDIAALFPLVKTGTPVTVVDRPFKLGWRGDDLFLEVTPTQAQADLIAAYQRPAPLDIPGLQRAIRQVAGDKADIDEEAVEKAVHQRSGIPVAIAHRTN